MLLSQYPYEDPTGPRAVVLIKPDSLPGSQEQLFAGDDKGHRRTHEACLGMGSRVALTVAELATVRRNKAQGEPHIAGNIGIGVFIYRYRGSCTYCQ